MKGPSLAGTVLPFVLLCASPALAQESGPDEEHSGPLWSLSIGAGTSLAKGADDPWSASVDLSRSLGDGRVGIGYSRSRDSGIPGVLLALGSKTDTVTLSGGYSIGALGLDAYVARGWRTFDARTLRRRTGQTVTLDGKGKSVAFGASASYWLPLSDSTSISPYAAIDFDRTDTARAALLPVLGLVSARDREKGTTGSAGVSLDHAFGAGLQHSIGATAGFVTTSNAAATSGTLTRRAGGTRTLRRRPGTSGSDSWGEIGANAGFSLGPAVSLSASAMRTIGAAGPESTSLSAGLSFAF